MGGEGGYAHTEFVQIVRLPGIVVTVAYIVKLFRAIHSSFLSRIGVTEFRRSHPQWTVIRRWGTKNLRFLTNRSVYISETVHHMFIVNIGSLIGSHMYLIEPRHFP